MLSTGLDVGAMSGNYSLLNNIFPADIVTALTDKYRQLEAEAKNEKVASEAKEELNERLNNAFLSGDFSTVEGDFQPATIAGFKATYERELQSANLGLQGQQLSIAQQQRNLNAPTSTATRVQQTTQPKQYSVTHQGSVRILR